MKKSGPTYREQDLGSIFDPQAARTIIGSIGVWTCQGELVYNEEYDQWQFIVPPEPESKEIPMKPVKKYGKTIWIPEYEPS